MSRDVTAMVGDSIAEPVPAGIYHRRVAAVTESAIARDPARVARSTANGSRAPLFALGAIVVVAFVGYTALGSLIDVPRVHPDEVRYAIAGSSLAEGEGLTMRGGEYGFGPLYALVLAGILLVAPGLAAAYDIFKAANALFFALTAIPVYLLARRLVSEWWAVLAAALAVAIPSSISVGTVMTESLAFFTAAWALYAIMLGLERPSIGRQLVVLAAVAAAFATRPQLGALYLTWLVGLGLFSLILPSGRHSRMDLIRLWPSAVPLVLAGGALAGRVLSGTSPRESFGAYWELWRGYDPVQIAKWFVYHLADFEIYVVVVPFAVAPIVLWTLLREGRAGSERAGAFASLFLSANITGLLVVSAFNSTPYAYDRLHDRYAFYLIPLWLVVLAMWLADGLPRPLVATATGVVVALALPAILPFRQLANEAGIDTVPGALWLWLESQTAGPGPLSGRLMLAVFVVVLLVAALLLPARLRLMIPVAVMTVFAATAILAWERLIDAPENAVLAGGYEPAWIDEALPDDARVTKLYIESEACPISRLTRHALFATEFFNVTVDRAAYIGDSTPDGIPLPRVEVVDRRLVFEDGSPFVADFVYTQPGIELTGQRLATGTAAGLVLWRTDGEVGLRNAQTTAEVRTADCE